MGRRWQWVGVGLVTLGFMVGIYWRRLDPLLRPNTAEMDRIMNVKHPCLLVYDSPGYPPSSIEDLPGPRSERTRSHPLR